jgi:hypothetical protein
MKYNKLIFAFVLPLLGLIGFLRVHAGFAQSPALSLNELAKKIDGAVVYQRGAAIYKTELGKNESVLISPAGEYPRWSPYGNFVAFVRKNQIMRIGADGTQEAVLATADDAHAVAYHPDGNSVLFTDGKTIKSVSLVDKSVKVILSGNNFRELDTVADGQKLVATIRWLGLSIRAFDLASGKDWKISSGCSGSLSPDGTLVTNNSSDHKQLFLRDWTSGKIVSSVAAPPDNTFDNQYWSNHPDWLASKAEKLENPGIFVHQISSNLAFQVTSGKDDDRPDFFVRQK